MNRRFYYWHQKHRQQDKGCNEEENVEYEETES
jgi:hypothetical protein